MTARISSIRTRRRTSTRHSLTAYMRRPHESTASKVLGFGALSHRDRSKSATIYLENRLRALRTLSLALAGAGGRASHGMHHLFFRKPYVGPRCNDQRSDSSAGGKLGGLTGIRRPIVERRSSRRADHHGHRIKILAKQELFEKTGVSGGFFSLLLQTGFRSVSLQQRDCEPS